MLELHIEYYIIMRKEDQTVEVDFKHPRHGKCLSVKSHTWISSNELCKKMEISRPCLYKLAKKKEWEFKFQKLPQGGRQKLYSIPDDMEFKHIEVATKPVVKTCSAEVPNLKPVEEIPHHQFELAKLRATLCELILDEFSITESRAKAWKSLTKAYNNGELVPELLAMDGTHGERTFQRWIKKYVDSENDMYSLVRGNSIPESSRKVTETEKNFLLHVLLSPNRISIGTAIRKLKQMDRIDKVKSPTGDRTLRRWCDDWQSNHKPEWNLLRHGRKALREKNLISVLRSNELKVGEVWVADGHNLAFDIIDPVTGKAKRMTMIMFYDWASRYPVGASLAVSEDSQHILLALRNSILNWGGKPKYVYLDNGKAFRSKLFNKKWEKHDLAKELAGIFPRLGIGAVFANAYNARAKVIERFFLTFQNDFERFMTTFRGASIADKPATLMRNEKWMKKLFEGKPLTVTQAKSMISLYIEKMYGLTPHGGLSGAKPFEVFTEAEIPEDQKIEPASLNFLMLAVANRIVQASGIRFNNVHYWDEALIDHVGDKVIIRYDLMDVRSILIYDAKNKFICQAGSRRLQHPFVHLATDKATSQKELAGELNYIRKLEKNIKESSEEIMLKVNEAVGAIQLPEPDIAGDLFSDQPLLDEIQVKLSIDDIVKMAHENDPVEPIKAKPANHEKNKEFDNQFDFHELMKAIGIEGV